MKPCIFCAILGGNAPASFVFQSESCSAFLDIFPMSVGHVLVVPNRHVVHLSEMSEDERTALFAVANRLLDAERRCGLVVEGANFLVNDGPGAKQQVPHVHIHIVPRTRGDGVKIAFRFLTRLMFGRPAKRETLETLAVRIREHLQ